MDKNIMVVGCDPKADSTRLLLGGLAQKTVLDTLREEGEEIELDYIMKDGRRHQMWNQVGQSQVLAVPAVASPIGMLEQLGAYTDDLDYVFYDVLGDAVRRFCNADP